MWPFVRKSKSTQLSEATQEALAEAALRQEKAADDLREAASRLLRAARNVEHVKN